jgi:hypothetical protein
MVDVTGFHFVDSIATPGGFVEVKDSHSIEFVALKTRDIVDPLTHVVCENAVAGSKHVVLRGGKRPIHESARWRFMTRPITHLRSRPPMQSLQYFLCLEPGC